MKITLSRHYHNCINITNQHKKATYSISKKNGSVSVAAGFQKVAKVGQTLPASYDGVAYWIILDDYMGP